MTRGSQRWLEAGTGALGVGLDLAMGALGVATVLAILGGPYWLAFVGARGEHPTWAGAFALAWTAVIAVFADRMRTSPSRPRWFWTFVAAALAFALLGRAWFVSTAS